MGMSTLLVAAALLVGLLAPGVEAKANKEVCGMQAGGKWDSINCLYSNPRIQRPSVFASYQLGVWMFLVMALIIFAFASFTASIDFSGDTRLMVDEPRDTDSSALTGGGGPAPAATPAAAPAAAAASW